ncbi:uncharacterized protein BCR38DRAFT_404677 [Pseudomassariella vexata]|uniref:Uncharacterized protein n=1 Tax=Pseudomassariella vexata TaxID=1141098 RepID=A0A1Y2EJ79_9PEZI|nr:uncharacterized protein BCR38DRAFT_404677 [Pseudomassariella vexata]ORY71611.1 hypothetical protein BCR38DRAFT_404677 [Pseudomassariella vexata]
MSTSLQSLGRWLRLKQYQIEVTFGVYIFTPIEKFVFWSVVFLLFSLTIIATMLYLPQHIVFVLNRALFYAYGDDSGVEHVLGGLAKNGAVAMQQTVEKLATSTADSAAETVEGLVREL